LSAKRTGTQKRTEHHHDACYAAAVGVRKGTSLNEVTSSSEEIKPIALSLVELCLGQGKS